MKKRKCILITVFILLCTTFTGAYCISASNAPIARIQEKYKNQNAEAMTKTIQKMNYQEISKEANTIVQYTNDLDSILYHACVMQSKIDDIPEDWLIAEITNKSNSDQYRYFLIELSTYKNDGKGLSNNYPIRQIAKDKEEDSMVRQNAMFSLMYDQASFDILVDLVADKDENVAFQSLKAVNMVHPDTAVKLSDDIINNNIEDLRLQMAIKVKALDYQRNPEKAKEISDFIVLCKNLYFNTNDQTMKNTTVFALSDLYQKEALKFIVEEESVDYSFKVACIDQNYLVLKDLLKNDPTKEDVDFASKCCKIYAVDEVVTLLNTTDKLDRSTNKSSFGEIHNANKVWDDQYYAGRK